MLCSAVWSGVSTDILNWDIFSDKFCTDIWNLFVDTFLEGTSRKNGDGFDNYWELGQCHSYGPYYGQWMEHGSVIVPGIHTVLEHYQVRHYFISHQQKPTHQTTS